jgi:hypothetical protein
MPRANRPIGARHLQANQGVLHTRLPDRGAPCMENARPVRASRQVEEQPWANVSISLAASPGGRAIDDCRADRARRL